MLIGLYQFMKDFDIMAPESPRDVRVIGFPTTRRAKTGHPNTLLVADYASIFSSKKARPSRVTTDRHGPSL